jgi:hypothetical protein
MQKVLHSAFYWILVGTRKRRETWKEEDSVGYVPVTSKLTFWETLGFVKEWRSK